MKEKESIFSRLLPYLLVTTVGVMILFSWAMKPNRASAEGTVSAAGGFLSANAGPSPSQVDCTQAPQGYSPYCHDAVESSPNVVIPVTATQNLFLAGSNASVDLAVSRVIGNRPPAATPFSLTTPGDQPISITLSGSDPDNDPLDFGISVYPRNGSISRSGADLTYTPNPGFQGQDAFAYVADDNRRRGGAVVTIQVGTFTNEPPMIGPLDRSLIFGQTATLSVSVTDHENNLVDVSLAAPDTLGDITGTPSSFVYDPGDVFGHDQFYVVADESNGGLQRSIRLVSMTIGDPFMQTSLYDGDPDAGAPQIGTTASHDATAGTVKITGINTLLFPNGTRTLFAKIVDSAGRIGVTSSDFQIDNEPPTIGWYQRPSQTYIRDNLTIGVTAYDNIRVQGVKFEVEAGGRLVRSEFLTQSPYLKENYDVRGLADGQTYFKFFAIDNAGNVSPTLISTYTVDNNAPVLSMYINGTRLIPTGAPVIISNTVPIRFEAADSGSGLSSLDVTFGSESTPRLTSPTSPLAYQWVTNNFSNGAISLSVHSRDSIGNQSTLVFPNIVIQNNNAPVAQNQTVSMPENTRRTVTLGGTDLDDPTGASLQFSVQTNPVNGTLSGTPPSVSYQPDAGFNGTDSFIFRVSDGQLSSTGRVDITITGVNDPPIADPISVAVSMDSFVFITPHGHDPEKGPLTFSPVNNPAHGILNSATWKYAPDTNYAGPDSFTYKANDGSLDSSPVAVTIDVQGTPINHLPTAVSKMITVPMGTVTPILLEGSDPDGQPITFRLLTEPAHGERSGSMPNLMYMPNRTFKGIDKLSYVVNDGIGDSEVAVVTMTVVDAVSPTVSFIEPADGASVSGFVSISGTATDNDVVQSVQILVDNNPVTTLPTPPYTFSLDTRPPFALGPHTIKLHAVDASGNPADVSRSVTVTPVAVTPPTIELTNPLNNQLLGGSVQVLARTTGDVTGVNLTVNGNVLPMVLTSAGRYALTWNTTEAGHYPDGTYLLDARATGAGGSAEASLHVTVDNTLPTGVWVLPTISRATIGLYGNQSFVVNAQDTNGIDHVEFWFSNQKYVVPTGTDNEFTFLFDTLPYAPGQNYGMLAVVVDRAGNSYTTPIRSFNVLSSPPPSDGVITEHPTDGTYVSSDNDSKISAVFTVGVQSAISDSSLQVYAKQNGVETKLSGVVKYSNSTLQFIGPIPANAEIRWVVNVLVDENRPLNSQFVFTRMMSKDTGGVVYADTDYSNSASQGRFQITIPPNALKEDMLVVIDPADVSLGTQGTDTALTSEGQREIAGPFKTYGRNAAHAEIHDLLRPATLLYYDLQPPLLADEQTRAVQIQSLDGSVWRPIGISDVAQASRAGSQVGTRSVSVPISSFSTFRVNSVPVAAAGIEGVFAFPNPFNPNQGGTSFQYTLSGNCDVDIVIYDLFGNLVRTMHWPAGSLGGQVSSTPPWDGRNGRGDVVANGGYIVHIVSHDAQGHVGKAIYKVGVVK